MRALQFRLLRAHDSVRYAATGCAECAHNAHDLAGKAPRRRKFPI